jgi:glycosyltransferase involved in cell wall biosynthesis
MKKLRVLIISHMFPSRLSKVAGMAGVFICRQAQFLARYDIESEFLVPCLWAPWPLYLFARWRSYSPENVLIGPKEFRAEIVRYLRPPGIWFRRFEGESMALGIRNTAVCWHRENPFDVVMGVSMFPDAEAAVIIGRKLNIPVAALVVGSDIMIYTQELPVLGERLGKLMTQIDLPIGVSQMLCDRMRQSGECKRQPLCIYLGRDTEKFSAAKNKNEIRARFGLTKSDIVAVYVGAISYFKGISELVVAAEKLLRKYRNFKLICVGNGPAMQELREFKEKVGRDGAVILPGLVIPNEVPSYLHVSDFMVFPSHSEGMPQSVLEAMNCGLPVVATKVGGVPEAVIDGQTGLLIDAKNPEQLEIAMERMIKDEEFRLSAGKRAIEYVNEKFDPESNAKKLAEALHFTKAAFKHL